MRPVYCILFAILTIFTIYHTVVATSQQQQAQLYASISQLNSLNEITTQQHTQLIHQLTSLPFDRFLMGLSQSSPLIRLLTLQSMELLLSNNDLNSKDLSSSNAIQQSTANHPYNLDLAALSNYFIDYYSKQPISYNLLPSDPATPQQYYVNEKKLVNEIFYPIITLAVTDTTPELRHLAISILSMTIQEFPGTSLLLIKLLQYYSGEDVYIGTKLFQGSLESDMMAGHPSKSNQRFLAKIIRLHLSTVIYHDFEQLLNASQAVLDLYQNESNSDTENDSSNHILDTTHGRQNERYQTLSRNLHTNDHVNHNNLNHHHRKTKSSIFTTLNIKDVTIDNVINQIHVVTANTEDHSVLFECSHALSRSKLSPDHLNTLYSLVISPYYDVSKSAINGIKRIGLISSVPGTITHTVEVEKHELGPLNPNIQSEDSNGKKKLQSIPTNSSTELAVSAQTPPTKVSKQYVSAVSQAELSTILQPQQGQLAIKILSASSKHHPHPHLQEISAIALNDVITEVKAQLETWYNMIRSKGLQMYQESDNTRSSIKDLQFTYRFLSASKKNRKQISLEHEAYQQKQQLHDQSGQVVSSIQQMIYSTRKTKQNYIPDSTTIPNTKSHKKYDNGSILISRKAKPSLSSSTKTDSKAPSSKHKSRSSTKRALLKELQRLETELFLSKTTTPSPSPPSPPYPPSSINANDKQTGEVDTNNNHNHGHNNDLAINNSGNNSGNNIPLIIPEITKDHTPSSSSQQQSA